MKERKNGYKGKHYDWRKAANKQRKQAWEKPTTDAVSPFVARRRQLEEAIANAPKRNCAFTGKPALTINLNGLSHHAIERIGEVPNMCFEVYKDSEIRARIDAEYELERSWREAEAKERRERNQTEAMKEYHKFALPKIFQFIRNEQPAILRSLVAA